jgi:nucleotide-binding universal stress UspA family protein
LIEASVFSNSHRTIFELFDALRVAKMNVKSPSTMKRPVAMSMPSSTTASLSDADSHAEPTGERRDEHGRRIALTFESARVRPVAPPANCWCVAIDGSAHSMHALTQAMQLAAESGANTLDIATVHHWLSTEAAETELAVRGLATSADARALLDSRGFAWRLHALMGEPAQRLVELSELLGARGIVIGARGLSAFDGLLLGSVAQQVIQNAHGSILVVRAPAAP